MATPKATKAPGRTRGIAPEPVAAPSVVPPQSAAPSEKRAWPNDGSRPWEAAFLKVLEERGNVTRAAEAVGIDRSTAYAARDADAEFKAKWEDAMKGYMDFLQGVCDQRATEGVKVPVVGRIGDGMDGILGYESKPSDQLLMFRMKRLDPSYVERREVTGKDGKPLIPENLMSRDLESMSEEELDALRRRIDQLDASAVPAH